MNKELYIKTLLHELTHMKQWVDGKLTLRHGKLCYSKKPVEEYSYWFQPHEIEARKYEEQLYSEYMNPIHYFPNRLMSDT